MRAFTLDEVVRFCWANKRRGFKDFTYRDVAQHIVWAAREDKLLIAQDGPFLVGACTFTEHETHIYIHHIVAISTGFACLVKEAFRRYPAHEIFGQRKGKVRKFNKQTLWAITHPQIKAPATC